MSRTPHYLYKQERKAALFFLLPLLVGLGVFYFFAFFQNVYFSFTDLGSFGKPRFIGLENYRRLFADPKFHRSLSNTLMYVVLCVPAIVILSTLNAFLLSKLQRMSTMFRTLLFLPAITMPAAIGILWRWLFNYKFGLINVLLNALKLESVAWLSEPDVVLYSVSIVLIWSMLATQMVILLAGMQNIPTMYYEAALIDGAGTMQSFFRITLPLLSPTLFFVITISIINVFQIFDFIFLMIRSTSLAIQYSSSLVYYFYDRSFVAFEKGYGVAVSLVLFVIILIVTIFQFVMQKRWVHYS
ncbi:MULTISPECIES: sugar ABC transporter permease [Sphaerochaeta]|uniref:Sugar ABC transporter permease n=2 Tax=root TaxID=1 RepID=A0ABY4D6S6_9SPIR|nr:MULTISPECIES: sugar ABC transporter permease [Sphaerochaeta]MDT3359265.1 sugar ABC transporter permease [Spirochaetota bacterium]NLA98879.1 sugar ABC transporter permease [Spirochaetales bacterium]MDD2395322.1 sugar ABC transporter permease [Sphaerochaeta sp.]MDD3425058.1 sugar ABC transporter permease [Sphaerochaeta sp.]MDD3457091.1 sugar ABC transporter permease [Sphaerochaeta sp.]